MRKLFISVGIIAGLVLAYMIVHLALIEVGQEIVILHKQAADGTIREARLWIVDDVGTSWLHHGYADDGWIHRLETDPIIEIERGGELRRYRAQPDPAADPNVHRLLREKYGAADRLVRFWAGTDIAAGFATGEPCTAVPVRLEPQ